MNAVEWTGYGPPEVLRLTDLPLPPMKPGDILVRVRAVAVSRSDTELRRLAGPLPLSLAFRFYLGVRRPRRIRILGGEFAGEVVGVSPGVSRFRVGDEVFGYTGLRLGAYAEYLSLPAAPSGVAGLVSRKPDGISFEEAAAAPIGGQEALHALARVHPGAGSNVLILGAGGSIGSFAVQLAKLRGAHVTGVDRREKLGLLRELGADRTLDYRTEDFTRYNVKYDLILDTINRTSFRRAMSALSDGGTYLNLNAGLLTRLRMTWASLRRRGQLLTWTSGYTLRNLQTLQELLESRQLRSVVDRRYALNEVVEAHRYVESDLKRGNVVMTVGGN